VDVAAKGGGSENKSKMAMLNPSDSIVDWVLKTVPTMGAGWCPPGMLGIGIGGTAEKAAVMAKEVLMDPIDIHELKARGPQNRIEELRLELFDKVNQLGIGAQGLGGLATVLDVKIMDYPTHAASLPVCMIPNCAATRHAHFVLDGSGPARGDGAFGDVRLSLGVEIPLGYTKVVTKEKTVIKTREVAAKPQPVMDSDGDGVPDNRDQCPNTLEGGRVDSNGCLIVNQTVTLTNINFEFDSAKLTRSSESSLDRIADSLKSQTDFRVEVAGHTDSVGAAEYNEQLSQERAESVRQYLLNRGVDPSRVTARGYGELNPVASNETESGRAMNRRVEFRVTEK